MKQSIRNTIGLSVVAAAMLCGCNKKLDLVPESKIGDETFWKTTNDLVLACNELYNSLPVMSNNVNAVWSDDGYAQAPNAISDGTRTIPVTDNAFSIPYTLIRKSNNILEKS